MFLSIYPRRAVSAFSTQSAKADENARQEQESAYKLINQLSEFIRAVYWLSKLYKEKYVIHLCFKISAFLYLYYSLYNSRQQSVTRVS